MLFAIAGSQGTGKSTVLKALKEKGYNLIDRKVSRSILADWGKSLDEVYRDLPLAQKFHDEIANRKWHDEMHAIESDGVWFTERTYADSYVYALLSLGRYNEYSEWLDTYYYLSQTNNRTAYRHVFYLPSGQFAIQNDGVRAHNIRYGKLVDETMSRVTLDMLENGGDNWYDTNITFMQSVDLEDRVREIQQVVDYELQK